MKYIDADKLITIIEERKAQQDQWINRYHDPINQGISQELNEILSIIASLQQGQPSLPSNLDEAAEKNFETMEVLEHENIFEETHRKIFKAGAEWMAGHALTTDDIKLITKIHYELVFKDTTGVKVGDIPSEVLRRFNELRKK